MNVKLSTFLFERDTTEAKHSEEAKPQIVNITTDPVVDSTDTVVDDASTSIPVAYKIRLVTP